MCTAMLSNSTPQLGKPPDPGHTGSSANLFGGKLSCASPFIHRVFGNCWDSDEDTPTRPQPQDHMPKMPDFDGYCSHNEEGPNGETEAQRWTATRQGQPAMAIALKGENPEGVETQRRSKLGPFVSSPAVDSTRETTVPPRELDGYLDSLFDPVLACGDAVGMQRDAVGMQVTGSVCVPET